MYRTGNAPERYRSQSAYFPALDESDTLWSNRNFIRTVAYLVRALEDFDAGLLLKLLLLSALRFAVFIIQYYLLFQLFAVSISWWECLWSVSITFFVLAVIPSFAIADIGLRGEVGIKLIGLFTINQLGILFTTITIWFVNLIVPAIIGSLLILGIKKLYTNKEDKKAQS